jgi:hypothetical protein
MRHRSGAKLFFAWAAASAVAGCIEERRSEVPAPDDGRSDDIDAAGSGGDGQAARPCLADCMRWSGLAILALLFTACIADKETRRLSDVDPDEDAGAVGGADAAGGADAGTGVRPDAGDEPSPARACIQVEPASRDFGAVLVGRTETRRVTIESCGDAPLEIRRFSLKAGTSDAFALSAPPGSPQVLPAAEAGAPNPAGAADVAFTPPDQEAYGGTLVIETNDATTCADAARAETCVVEVPLVGRGVLNACPVPVAGETALDVRPLDVVELDASASHDPDGTIAKYGWVVVSRPEGSTQEPAEGFPNPRRPQDGQRPDDEATPEARLFIDIAGEYVLELHVVDDQGAESPSTACPEPVARVTIRAVPDRALDVQLVWNTPGDGIQTDNEGTDLDLHFLHPDARGWGVAPLDCYFANPHPDWGRRADPADDPSLDIDDIDGAGPESASLERPEDTDMFQSGYDVGVHYFRAENFNSGGTYGPSDATLRIYLGGALAYEKTRRLQVTDNFWHVAEIRWTPAVREVVDIDRFVEEVYVHP